MASDDPFAAALLSRIRANREALRRLEDRLGAIERERDLARSRIDAAEAMYKAEFGDLPKLQAGVVVPPETGSTTKTQSRSRRDLPRSEVEGPLTGSSWHEAIRSVLTEAGEPLHVREIWQQLDSRGFRTDARDPLRSIVAVCLRMPGVVRAGPNTYTVAGGSKTAQVPVDPA